MAAPDQFFPLLSALSRIFNREEEMPKEPTTCLRRVGWIVADTLQRDGAMPSGHSLAEELRSVTPGWRSMLVWNPYSMSVVNPNNPAVQHGWVLKEVADTCRSTLNKSAKLRYDYTSPITGKIHPLQLTTRGGGTHEFAAFAVHGNLIHWYQNEEFCTFAHTCLKGALEDVDLELVAVSATDVTYARYSIKKNDCIVHRTDTFEHLETVCVLHFDGDEALGRVPYIRQFLMDNMLNYSSENEAIIWHLSHTQSVKDRLERLSRDLRAVTCLEKRQDSTLGPVVVCLPHLSLRLTERRRARLLRVARTLLVARAQEAEERRAADPVKKCAACAVEAVKSQLALGIENTEPSAKRTCARA
tara:strand:+ start:3830 stop:4903 length:1074 start_codon:yes stop_codon:yes gene_type:complete